MIAEEPVNPITFNTFSPGSGALEGSFPETPEKYVISGYFQPPSIVMEAARQVRSVRTAAIPPARC